MILISRCNVANPHHLPIDVDGSSTTVIAAKRGGACKIRYRPNGCPEDGMLITRGIVAPPYCLQLREVVANSRGISSVITGVPANNRGYYVFTNGSEILHPRTACPEECTLSTRGIVGPTHRLPIVVDVRRTTLRSAKGAEILHR